MKDIFLKVPTTEKIKGRIKKIKLLEGSQLKLSAYYAELLEFGLKAKAKQLLMTFEGKDNEH